jgi:hypothetical protein
VREKALTRIEWLRSKASRPEELAYDDQIAQIGGGTSRIGRGHWAILL